MMNQSIYAVAYDLELNIEISKPEILVTFSWIFENKNELAIIAPQKWDCKLPTRRNFSDFLLGTSETRGMLGGVHHPFLEAQSEVIERIIGDSLTTCIADILDINQGSSTILILGPAFPKIIGRILSLHPPDDVGIAWIVPDIAPNEKIGYLWRLLMPFHPYEHPPEWSEEALLNYATYPSDKEPRFWIQYIERGNGEKAKEKIIGALSSPSLKPGSSTIPSNGKQSSIFRLPREMGLALNVLEITKENDIKQWLSNEGFNYLDFGKKNLPQYLLRSTARGRPTYSWK